MMAGNMNVYEMAEYVAGEKVIVDSIGMTYAMMGKYRYPACSISGGSDSDIILDLCSRLDSEKKLRYVWMNTGLEFQATKDHLSDIEKKYNVSIERIPAIKSIPQSCREYGVPFVSKFASTQIEKLQENSFKWEDEPLPVLKEKYPKCPSALRWWTNDYSRREWNIGNFHHLKEFMTENPPEFKISSQCCTWAKKKPVYVWGKKNGIDLHILGLRKVEGGIRAASTKTCFTSGAQNIFRPIFWYSDKDKITYERLFGVTHSRCYTDYGMKRTGCVGCPFNRDVLSELEIIEKNEPGLYRAACKVFEKSYEYTRLYRKFAGMTRAESMKKKLFDL